MSQYTLPYVYPWEADVTVGVPGGIPEDRTNIINVVTAYGADNTNGVDASAAVQTALNAAVNNDIVYLPPGTYRWDTIVSVPLFKGITLRGAGSSTIINFTRDHSGGPAIRMQGGDYYLWPPEAAEEPRLPCDE